MSALRPIAAAALVASLLAGCGGSGPRTPRLSRLPLVAGLQISAMTRACNPGADAYCALQFVAVGHRYPTSQAIFQAESRLLHRQGWHHANAPVGQETAADAPGDRLRVTFATASQELEAIDLGWIKRPRKLTLALDRALFAHTSALSMQLEVGTTNP